MNTRLAVPQDAPAMQRLLNAIIAIGGTTAHEHALTQKYILASYIDGPDTISCVVAEADGQVIGFQGLGWWNGEVHIGTFVDPHLQARGSGAALFAATCRIAHEKGVAEIIASIRADNAAGLAYYARIGFADVSFDPDFALSDGRIVGRVHRRFDLMTDDAHV